MTSEDLFRMTDVDNNQKIELSEMTETVKICSEFKHKELKAIHNYFDIDNNGHIDRQEWETQMKKAIAKYDKHRNLKSIFPSIHK